MFTIEIRAFSKHPKAPYTNEVIAKVASTWDRRLSQRLLQEFVSGVNVQPQIYGRLDLDVDRSLAKGNYLEYLGSWTGPLDEGRAKQIAGGFERAVVVADRLDHRLGCGEIDQLCVELVQHDVACVLRERLLRESVDYLRKLIVASGGAYDHATDKEFKDEIRRTTAKIVGLAP